MRIVSTALLTGVHISSNETLLMLVERLSGMERLLKRSRLQEPDQNDLQGSTEVSGEHGRRCESRESEHLLQMQDSASSPALIPSPASPVTHEPMRSPRVDQGQHTTSFPTFPIDLLKYAGPKMPSDYTVGPEIHSTLNAALELTERACADERRSTLASPHAAPNIYQEDLCPHIEVFNVLFSGK